MQKISELYAIQEYQPLYVKAVITPTDIKFEPLEYNQALKQMITDELERFGFYQKMMKNIIATSSFDQKTNQIRMNYKRLPFAQNPEKITLDLPNNQHADILVCWSM